MSYSLFWILQLRFSHLPVYFSHLSFWFLFFTPAGFDSNLSHAKWHLMLETEIDPTKHVSFNLLLIIPMQMAQNKYTIKIKWTLEDKHPFLNQFYCYYFFAGNVFFFFFWRLITFQYCIGFAIHWHESTLVYMCSPSDISSHPSPSHTSGSSQCTSPENPVSCIKHGLVIHSHMIIYMFQCHSPKPSHPRPIPQSPKDCSIHLCLFCCLAYRVIITTSLNSIYMH